MKIFVQEEKSGGGKAGRGRAGEGNGISTDDPGVEFSNEISCLCFSNTNGPGFIIEKLWCCI